MGIIRPATPGFLVTLIATALLAVVSFNVPFLKSVFFLKASVTTGNSVESVAFGTLGYCLTLPNGTTCSKPSVGYQLDVNSLLGDNTIIKIPQVVVKWITYALVLHIVALVLAGISAVFGLLAHVREMSMVYCSTCVSGFAAAVALIAFIFDIVLFFVTKSRINAVSGGHAIIGLSIWLTLAAWILLFFAGCFFGLGRCCISRRPRGMDRDARPNPDNMYAEQMRLEAVKAEADRKARQAAGKNEIGLPAFQEYERQPLTAKTDEPYVEEGDQIVPYHAQASSGGAGVGAGTAAYARQANQQPQYAGGYAQATPGTRTVDAYYSNSAPSPGRQASVHTQAPSVYRDPYSPSGAAPAAAATAAGGYLAADPYSQYGHQQQPSAASYGHMPLGSSYHSAVSQRDNGYSGYGNANYNSGSTVDPFAAQPSQTAFNPDTYSSTNYMYGAQAASTSSGPDTNPYRSTPERNYTLGGGGYGANVVPTLDYGRGSPAPSTSVYSSTSVPIPHPHPTINTSISPPPMPQPTSPRGPREPTPSVPVAAPIVESPVREEPHYSDSPPMYDETTAQPSGQWGAKH